ncbi:MAG: hypothetical protein SGPRY_013037, partial [Prymnesium sp.]
MNCAALCASTLPSFLSGAYSVPVIAPLVGGVLGGCGGAFLPADKGLKPLEAGTNWRIKSAVVVSCWLQFSMRDPSTKGIVADLVPALGNQ